MRRTVWELRWFASPHPFHDWRDADGCMASSWSLHLWDPPHFVHRPRTLRLVPAWFRLADALAGEIPVCPKCLLHRQEGESWTTTARIACVRMR